MQALLRDLNIFANPIFIKSCRARLRLRALITWCSITLIVSGLVFASVYLTTTARHLADPAYAARATFVPIMWIQSIILMLLGTGSVASGLSIEREDGTLDYLRLTPMRPLPKILGYLFGLPVREYLMFLTTLPFTLFCVIKGGISILSVLQLYLVFITSVWLYHMTGMVAGMIAKKPRRAGWFARLLVVGLYLVVPQMYKFGFSFLGYLTFLPAFYGIMSGELGGVASETSMWRSVKFFTIALPPTLYSLAIQSGLLFTFYSVVRRKWLQQTLHAFSKGSALIFFAALQVLVLGSLWPFLTGDRTVAFAQMGSVPPEWVWFGVFYLFFFLSGSACLLLVSSITPTWDTFLGGVRRAKKLGHPRTPWLTDGASSRIPTLIISSITAICYLGLVYLALPRDPSTQFSFAFGGHLLVVILMFVTHQLLQSVIELWSTRGLAALVGLLWMLPSAIAGILMSAWGAFLAAAYLATFTPMAAFAYALGNLLPEPVKDGPAASVVEHLWPLLIVSLAIFVGLTVLLQWRLFKLQRAAMEGKGT